MARCNSCDGIIGRDCFNPNECAWIGLCQKQQREWDQECAIANLERRIKDMERRMSDYDQGK